VTAPGLPEELTLVSVDDHICEPAAMFDAHVPERYRKHAPRVVDEADGSQQWYYGEIRGRNLGLNAVAGKSPEYFNVDPLRYEHMRPGSYDVHERWALAEARTDRMFGRHLAVLDDGERSLLVDLLPDLVASVAT